MREGVVAVLAAYLLSWVAFVLVRRLLVGRKERRGVIGAQNLPEGCEMVADMPRCAAVHGAAGVTALARIGPRPLDPRLL
jgi:hypothetical protein